MQFVRVVGPGPTKIVEDNQIYNTAGIGKT
jgi:hypothetical protein